MSSADHFKAVSVHKLITDIFAPAVSSTSGGRIEPIFAIIGWVRPQKIAQSTIMRNILLPIDISDLVEVINFRRKSSMQAENLVLDFSCDWQALEKFSKEFPDEVSSVFFEALVIEAIEFVDLPVLMVASEYRDPVLVLNFEQDNVEKRLHAVEPTINVVSHEEVVGGLNRCISTGSLPQI